MFLHHRTFQERVVESVGIRSVLFLGFSLLLKPNGLPEMTKVVESSSLTTISFLGHTSQAIHLFSLHEYCIFSPSTYTLLSFSNPFTTGSHISFHLHLSSTFISAHFRRLRRACKNGNCTQGWSVEHLGQQSTVLDLALENARLFFLVVIRSIVIWWDVCVLSQRKTFVYS